MACSEKIIIEDIPADLKHLAHIVQTKFDQLFAFSTSNLALLDQKVFRLPTITVV